MSTPAKGTGKAAPEQAPSFTPVSRPLLQRRCACGVHTGGVDCADCGRKRLAQRQAADGERAAARAPAVVEEALRADGQPLDPVLRAEMESRFNYDFRRVRVHSDAASAASARAVNALAYTVGSDIVFAAGQYQPATPAGRKLLAHELAHTIQQGGVGRAAGYVAVDPALNAVLESEADRAASLIAHPAPGQTAAAAVLTRLSEPLLSRAADDEAVFDWEALPAKDKLRDKGATHRSRMKAGHESEPDMSAFRFRVFPMPPTKGPVAKKLWDARAQAGALRAFIGYRTSKGRVIAYAALKQDRTKTAGLRENWLKKVGWDPAEAAANWHDSGGDETKGKVFDPKVDGRTCEMDHCVELQIGGTNLDENIQVLDADDNQSSGREVFSFLKEKADEVRDEHKDLDTVVLQFDTVEQKGQVACRPNTCCAVEQTIGKGKRAAAQIAADRRAYPLSSAGASTVLQVPISFGKSKKGEETTPIYDDPENRVAAEIIPGLLLRTLRSKAGSDYVHAQIDANDVTGEKRKTRVPISLIDEAQPVTLNVQKAGKSKGELSFAKGTSSKLRFAYPYLSEGTITDLRIDKSGALRGEGSLKPSVPLLRETTVGVKLGPDLLEAKADINKDKLAVPIPGMRVTKASVGLVLHPEFKPSGKIAFEVGPQKKPYADGVLDVSSDARGFLAKGDVRAHIPGVDEGKGTVTYSKKDGWSGRIEIRSSSLPGVKTAAVDATIGAEGLVATGNVKLQIPKGPELDLTLERDKSGKITYAGKTTIDVPRLKPVDLAFTYDGEHITANGETGFAYKSLSGVMKVYYNDGRIHGESDLKIDKGRVKGALHVTLHESHKLSGNGSVTIEIREGLLATAGIEIDKDEKVAVKGDLEITKPFKLFDGFGDKKSLFTLPTISIPVPGASIGVVGLEVRVGAEVGCEYRIGPGQVTHAKITAKLNPLDPDPNLDVKATATAGIPAHASIWASVTGEIAIDAKIASVSGGVRVSAIADLDGGVGGTIELHLTGNALTLDAVALINAALALILKLEAIARARAGVGPFSVGAEKTWDLAEYKYNTGLAFTLSAPLHYDSRETFKPPSFDAIKLSPVKLSPEDVLKQTMANRGQEKPT